MIHTSDIKFEKWYLKGNINFYSQYAYIIVCKN